MRTEKRPTGASPKAPERPLKPYDVAALEDRETDAFLRGVKMAEDGKVPGLRNAHVR